MKKEKSTFAGFGAALLAVLGSITCCGAPIAAGILASVGIGASQLQFLNSIQPYLIAVALFSLAIGFYRLYFKKNTSCCGPNPGETQPSNKKSKIFLWIVSIFTIGMLIYTNKSSQATEGDCCPQPAEETSCCTSSSSLNSQASCGSSCGAQAPVQIATKEIQSSCCTANNHEMASFKLKGLSKSCCIKPLVKKLQNESRINNFAIRKEKDMIAIKYDKNIISIKEIQTLLASAGFEVKQLK